jgi:hypothetical protein
MSMMMMIMMMMMMMTNKNIAKTLAFDNGRLANCQQQADSPNAPVGLTNPRNMPPNFLVFYVKQVADPPICMNYDICEK